MKQTFTLVWGLVILAVGTWAVHAQDTMGSDFNAQVGKATAPSSNEVKPNEIVKGNITYSGIVVEMLKTDNPLQLVNPFAPAKYGSADDNTITDPVTSKVYDPTVGISRPWKLFSIRF